MSIIVLHDAPRKAWLRFLNPVEVCQTRQVEEVLPALQRVANLVESRGLYAAGFLSYEAAPAFDPALQTHPPARLPLLWFGLYKQAEPIELPGAAGQPGYQFGEWAANLSRAEYATTIASIKDAIARGETYQVNFTMRLRASFNGDPWALFLQLNRNQASDYAAYLELDDFVICSASPELFFRLEDGTITGRPMKGTARRGLTTADDRRLQAWLRASEKNRAENVMIVDMLRNDLGRIADTGSVQVPSLFDIERYPTVWQMTSTVTACTQASLPEIFTALFPCASITGAPKVRTMKIIQRLEPEPRQVYTGSIGFIAPGRRAQFNVAIRSVLIDLQQQQAEYGVGGGIIWDSDAEDEYQECLIKAGVLSQNQPDFSLLETLLWQPGEGYFLLERHLERLEQSAEYFAYPFERKQAYRALQEKVSSFGSEPQRVRLLLDRQGQLEFQAVPLAQVPAPPVPRLKLAKAPVNSQDVFLYHKTTHRKVYETLKAVVPNCDDVILWNERGELTETCTSNLILELEGKLVTPPVSCGLLPGVYREWLLSQGRVRERVVTLQDLPRCTKIYVVNSVRKQRLAVFD